MEATRHRGAFLRAFQFAQRLKDAASWGVDRMDPVAAVFSCKQCSGLHAEVFSGRPTLIPRWNTPPVDAPPSMPDQGEGTED
jgi:hypothetical protein